MTPPASRPEFSPEARQAYYGLRSARHGAAQSVQEELFRKVSRYHAQVNLAHVLSLLKALTDARQFDLLVARCYAYTDLAEMVSAEARFAFSVLAEITPPSLSVARKTFTALAGHEAGGLIALTALDVFLGNSSEEYLSREVERMQEPSDRMIVAWAAIGAFVIAIGAYFLRAAYSASQQYSLVARLGRGQRWAEKLLCARPRREWTVVSALNAARLTESELAEAMPALATLPGFSLITPKAGDVFEGQRSHRGTGTPATGYVTKCLMPGLRSDQGAIVVPATVETGTSDFVAVQGTHRSPLTKRYLEEFSKAHGRDFSPTDTLSTDGLKEVADASDFEALNKWIQSIVEKAPDGAFRAITPSKGDAYLGTQMLTAGQLVNKRDAVVDKLLRSGLATVEGVLLKAIVAAKDTNTGA